MEITVCQQREMRNKKLKAKTTFKLAKCAQVKTLFVRTSM
jgi:hypothetical protein